MWVVLNQEVKSTKVSTQQTIKASEILNYVEFNANHCTSLALSVQMKFSRQMGTISSSQQIIKEKVAQFKKKLD